MKRRCSQAGLVGGLVQTGEAVVGQCLYLADAEEGRAGREVVQARCRYRTDGVGPPIIMIAGLVIGQWCCTRTATNCRPSSPSG